MDLYTMYILFVYSNKTDPCTIKSCFDLSRGLKKYAHTHEIDYRELNEEVVSDYDVIIFQRLGANGTVIENLYAQRIFHLITTYHHQKRFIYMIDDLVFEDQNQLPKKLMTACHAVICPNDNLANEAKPYNIHTYVLRTYIDMKQTVKIKGANDHIGYDMAWVSTGALGKAFIKEIMDHLRQDIDIRMIAISGDVRYFSGIKGIASYPFLPYEDMIAIVKNVNILLNPVIINDRFVTPRIEERSKKSAKDFFDCKSEIKYAIAGGTKTAIITSKTAPYLYAVKHMENGLLVDNRVEDWVKAIKQLYHHKRLRRRIIRNAHRDVKKRYTLEYGAKKAYALFRDIRSQPIQSP